MYNRIWKITMMCWLLMGLGAAMGQDVPPDRDLKIKRLDENLNTHPKTDPCDGWRDLIEPDMSNCVVKPGSWKYEDGVLTTQEKSQDIFLKDKFGDFILDMEFKLTEGANSGIIIRSGVMGNTFDWLHEGIEVQIYDTYGKKPSRNSCGAI